MSYELEKKLKEAGFPQEPTIELGGGCDGQMEKYGFYFCAKPGTCGYDGLCSEADLKKNQEKGMVCIKLPTLSELIEACGDDIKRIDFIHDMNLIIAYIAYSEDSLHKEGRGITPSEAVAHLWLELNKK